MAVGTVNVQKILTLYSILFWLKLCCFMQLYFKILGGMANSVNPDQTAPCLIWVCTVCICHFVRHFVRNLGHSIISNAHSGFSVDFSGMKKNIWNDFSLPFGIVMSLNH